MTNLSPIDWLRNRKVAVVYDWLGPEYGGAEWVLLVLHDLVPTAELFVTVQSVNSTKFWPITHTSWAQRLPWFRENYRWTLPLQPILTESHDLSKFEIIISMTSFASKGVVTSPHQLHVCYLLTPPRFLYTHQNSVQLSLIESTLLNPLKKYLRWWDQMASFRPDKIIPISTKVKLLAEQVYSSKIDQVLIPPIQTAPSQPTHPRSDNWLVLSRLVSYKNVHQVIDSCIQAHQRLSIIGSGPEQKRLEKQCADHPGIKLLGSVNDDQKWQMLATAKGLIILGEEDFGVTALEALQLHTPLILNKHSGVAEIIAGNPLVTLIEPSQLTTTLKNWQAETCQSTIDMKKYDKKAWQHRLTSIIQATYQEHYVEL